MLPASFLASDGFQFQAVRDYHHHSDIGTISTSSHPGLVIYATVTFNPDFTTPLISVTTSTITQ
jgi:hypothetical protein